MNSLRTSVEWTYGGVIVPFQTIHSKHHKKYFLSTGLLNTMLYQQFHAIFSFTIVMYASMVNLLSSLIS
jgi:hypothetical protein